MVSKYRDILEPPAEIQMQRASPIMQHATPSQGNCVIYARIFFIQHGSLTFSPCSLQNNKKKYLIKNFTRKRLLVKYQKKKKCTTNIPPHIYINLFFLCISFEFITRCFVNKLDNLKIIIIICITNRNDNIKYAHHLRKKTTYL